MTIITERTGHIKALYRLMFLMCCAFLACTLLNAQPLEPIAPPTTPNTKISNLNSSFGYVRAKASPDECWIGLGQNVRWNFPSLLTPSQPCPTGQIPKVNQGYIWGQVLVGTQIFFGTFANPNCLGAGAHVETDPIYIENSFACEIDASPYSNTNGGPYPPNLADARPPRMYIYDIPSRTIRDITPKLGGTPPASICSSTGINPFCNDVLWNSTVGIRSAVSYVEPTTNRTYVIVSGQGFVQGTQNAINFFIWGITENRWVGKFQYTGYSDMRRWVKHNNIVYGAVFKPSQVGGALLRYTGNFTVIPPSVPSAANGYNAIPACGTTSTANPPTGASFCIAFQNVGDFDTPASEVNVAPPGTLDAGRIFVGTWPPLGGNPLGLAAGLYMSPVVPAGGLTPAHAATWNKVWNAGNYDPDPLMKQTYGMGGMAFFNGYLYWGTLNPTLASLNKFLNTYGRPTTNEEWVTVTANTSRTAVLLRGRDFSTGVPKVDLLYGESTLPVYTPPSGSNPGSWKQTKNNIPSGACLTGCGVPGLYGHAGFNNVFTNYMWTMAVANNRLYVGTMNWGYLLYIHAIYLDVPILPNVYPQPEKFGAQLFYFPDANRAAIPVSTNGVGNFLNYGIRSIIPYSPTSLYIGTANPMNLATGGGIITGSACSAPVCRGGWELIELNPAGTVVTR